MRLRFLHLADVHLGTYHWGSQARARDYGRAFRWAAEYAARSRSGPGEPVRLVLVAGDLFDRAGIDAATHDEAYDSLRTFKAAGIPVLVTEGNHDHPKDREAKSWLESFNDRGQLLYLDAQFRSQPNPDGRSEMRCALVPYDRDRLAGSYLDFDGLRIVGMRYVGHALRRCLDAMAAALDELPRQGIQRTVLMLHGGVEGVIPGYKAEVTRDHLELLAPKLDYLALGHIHKRFTNRDLDDPFGRQEHMREWIVNPGSLQTWRRDEAAWRHGFYDVTLDDSLPAGREVRFVEVPDRPIAVLQLNVEEAASPADLLALARQMMEREQALLPNDQQPLAFLVLTGRLRFDRRELDPGELDDMLREIFNPVAQDVADRTLLTEADVRDAQAWDAPLDQAALEREIFRQLWLADERDLPYADQLADVTQQVKSMVLENLTAGEVVDHLLASYRALRAGAPNGPSAGLNS